MIRHMSQIVKTPIPSHKSAQVLSMLDQMHATGNSYCIDDTGSIRIIPEDRVDQLQQSMRSLVPTKEKGHGLTVFDNPRISRLLDKPGQVKFAPTVTTYSHTDNIRDVQPLHGSPPPSSPVFSQPGFSCDSPPSSLPNHASRHQNFENYSGGTDGNYSSMRTRSRTQSSVTHSSDQVETPVEPTGSGRAPCFTTRKRRKR